MKLNIDVKMMKCRLRNVSRLPGNQHRILYFAPATAHYQAEVLLQQACEGIHISGTWECLPMPSCTALSSHQLTNLLCYALDYVDIKGGQSCTFVGSDTPDLPVHEIVIGQLLASGSSDSGTNASVGAASGGVMRGEGTRELSDHVDNSNISNSRNSSEKHCYICPAQDGGYVLLTLPLPLSLPLSLPSQTSHPTELEKQPISISPPPFSSSRTLKGSGKQHSSSDIGSMSSLSRTSSISCDRSKHRLVFSPVEWSSTQTLSTQVSALEACNLHVHVGHEVYTDMDEPPDLLQLIDMSSLYLSEVESAQLLACDISTTCVKYVNSITQGEVDKAGRGSDCRMANEDAGRFRFVSPPVHTLRALKGFCAEKLNSLNLI